MRHVSLLLLVGTMGFAWLNMTLLEWPQSESRLHTLHGPNAHVTEAAMERFLKEALSQGQTARVDELVSEFYVAKSLHNDAILIEGREALKKAITKARLEFPEFELMLTDYSVYDTRDVFYWPGGELLAGGIPLMDPDARSGMYGIAIFCFEDGVLNQAYFNRFYGYLPNIEFKSV